MAEGGNKRLILCRFFSQGFCRNENDCEFSHDEGSAIRVGDSVCWYNLANRCVYGSTCRFSHVSADEIVNPDNVAFEEDNIEPYSITASNTVNTSQENCESIDALPEEADPSFSDYCVDENSEPYTFVEKTPSNRQAPENNAIEQHEPTSKPLPTSGLPKTYADTLKHHDESQMKADAPLCPFAIINSECVIKMRGENCEFIHGDMCDLCNCLCLHPYNQQQRDQHRDDCIRNHEREMEISFAVKRSIDKTCGICMDVIMEKEPPSERRFGILEKCAHIFCLSCIRKWRQTKQFDNKTIRACPECRVASDFVVPNKYWVDTVEEKDKLIVNYKKNLSLKPCKYFKQGSGECPFAGACFYLHAYPDGTKAEMPPPRARRRQAQDGDLETIRDMLLWNYLEIRDDRQFLMTDLEDMIGMHELGFFSDSDDDTDYTDYLLE